MIQQKYRLFAMPDNTETRKSAEKQRFHYIRPGKYILVYTQDGIPNAPAISGEEMKRLNRTELEWLLDCGDRITAEWLKENEPEVAETAGRFLTEFQKELEAERERIKREAG